MTRDELSKKAWFRIVAQIWDQVWNQVRKKICDHTSIRSQVSDAILDRIGWYQRGDPLQQAWGQIGRQAKEDDDDQ